MADSKITDLPAASALAGTEEFEVVQAGSNKSATAAQIQTFVVSGVAPPADPPEGSYAPGSYTIATGKFRHAVKRQQFTTTQRLTIQGTGRLSLGN